MYVSRTMWLLLLLAGGTDNVDDGVLTLARGLMRGIPSIKAINWSFLPCVADVKKYSVSLGYGFEFTRGCITGEDEIKSGSSEPKCSRRLDACTSYPDTYRPCPLSLL